MCAYVCKEQLCLVQAVIGGVWYAGLRQGAARAAEPHAVAAAVALSRSSFNTMVWNFTQLACLRGWRREGANGANCTSKSKTPPFGASRAEDSSRSILDVNIHLLWVLSLGGEDGRNGGSGREVVICADEGWSMSRRAD